jgi:hypothetical protein
MHIMFVWSILYPLGPHVCVVRPEMAWLRKPAWPNSRLPLSPRLYSAFLGLNLESHNWDDIYGYPENILEWLLDTNKC